MPYSAMKAGWTRHPKVAQTKLVDRWIWLCAIDYCVEFRTEGHLPVFDAIPGLTEAVAARLVKAGLFEKDSKGSTWIHDFGDFNGTRLRREQGRLRQQAKRERDKERSVA